MELAGVVQVDDLDHFVAITTAWHTQRVGQVKQLLEVPEGTAFEIGEGSEATEIVLTGDTLAGFKFGLEMALMQLGTLPFVAEMEDEAPGDAKG
jgi:hypothetical protein